MKKRKRKGKNEERKPKKTNCTKDQRKERKQIRQKKKTISCSKINLKRPVENSL